MKSIIPVLILILTYTKLFSQRNDDSLNTVLITKLIQEKEIIGKKDADSYKKNLFTTEFIKDSNNPSTYSIIKFGVTYTHSNRYFCYLFPNKVILTKSFDIDENLSALLSLFASCEVTFTSKLKLIEKLISEIKYERSTWIYKGNLPQPTSGN